MIDWNADHYRKLVELDPGNLQYRKKFAYFEKEQQRLQEWRDNPHLALEITRQSWTTGGFGSVMLLDLSIRNKTSWWIKDPVIWCGLYASSGTQVDAVRATAYVEFRGNVTKRVRQLNMGFIHNQAARASCKLVDASPG